MDKEELIAQYFNGQISEEGFSRIQALLEEDDAFKKEFYSQLEIQQAIAQLKHAPLKERLKKLDQKPIRKIKWYPYAAAAAILIIIGLLFYRSEPPYEKLYATNFEPYPNVIAPTLRDQERFEADMVATAFSYYDSRRYADAARAFEKIYQANGEDYAFFYQSMSLMAQGDIEEGVTALENHAWTQEDVYQIIAYWYVGLGYVELQNKEQAVFYLQRVADSSHPKAQKATEILEKLE